MRRFSEIGRGTAFAAQRCSSVRHRATGCRKIPEVTCSNRPRLDVSRHIPVRTRREETAMEDHADDKWITRQELADRYGVPVKTPAEWASKGTGPRYAKFGRHVRYLLSDVIDWERKRFAENKRDSA
jgi:predicted DNA-binding transcriptional regulator AlpA